MKQYSGYLASDPKLFCVWAGVAHWGGGTHHLKAQVNLRNTCNGIQPYDWTVQGYDQKALHIMVGLID